METFAIDDDFALAWCKPPSRSDCFDHACGRAKVSKGHLTVKHHLGVANQ